jgi:hypothetical protein
LNEMSSEVEMFVQIVAVKKCHDQQFSVLPLKVRPKLIKKHIENIEENEYLC